MTDLLAQLRQRIESAIAELGGDAKLPLVLDRTKDASMGDIGLACFPFAKPLKKSPPDVAAAIAELVPPDELIEATTATGPFVNFRYRRERLAEETVRGILEGRAPWGRWDDNDTSVVIDFSSPNIAKPFHFGHLRSTVIGAALRRLYAHCGYTVHGINHLGDWGSQFGKVIVAWRHWGSEEELQANAMKHLLDIYARFHQEAKQNEELEAAARVAFQRLESGEDNEERRLWSHLREVSLRAFDKTYARLGVEFDAVTGESFYEDKVEDTIQRIQDSGIAVMSEGALVVEVDGMPPCILRKSDGTTIYATRDLAALYYRRETYGFKKALYVVGGEQKLHFRQLRAVIDKLGWSEAQGIEHIDFGLVLSKTEDGRWTKFSTREGRTVFLDEVLDEAVQRIQGIIDEKNPDLADKAAIAESIGVSAIVFNDLKNGRIKDVKFDWEAMLSFEGETGPYVQYAGARLASILRKAGGVPEGEIDFAQLADADKVLLTLQEFGPTLQRCIDKNEPSTLTTLMIKTAATIHSYLKEHHVLTAEPAVRDARLCLVAAARQVLTKGLGLLGVSSPDQM